MASKKDPTLTELGLVDGLPLLVALDEAGASTFRVSLAELRQAATKVEAWGRRMDGQTVYRTRELRRVLGLPEFEVHHTRPTGQTAYEPF